MRFTGYQYFRLAETFHSFILLIFRRKRASPVLAQDNSWQRGCYHQTLPWEEKKFVILSERINVVAESALLILNEPKDHQSIKESFYYSCPIIIQGLPRLNVKKTVTFFPFGLVLRRLWKVSGSIGEPRFFITTSPASTSRSQWLSVFR